MKSQQRRILAATVVLCLAITLAAWATTRNLLSDLPDRSAIARIGETPQSTIVFDATDQPAFTISRQERIDIPLERVSPDFVRALIAIEDQRFYSHGAINAPRIAAAAFTNLLRGRAVQGGSTLTQQLARMSFLTPNKTVRRKLQEIILADRIERQYSKQQILELYINRVYFGAGLWGVEAASLGYVGKHAADLTLTEAALLAGLVKAPSTYAPTSGLEKAIRRRDVVLQTMYDTGAIDRPTLTQAIGASIVLKDALSRHDARGEYFFEEVRKRLIDQFGAERVYEGGLRVYATIDPKMQAAAEAAVAASLESLENRRRRAKSQARPEDDRLQAALIAMEPGTGYVRALVGGRNFAASPFNRATQARRQSGSAFKPFVYAAALEAGYTQTSIIDRLDEPISTAEGAWLPDDDNPDAQSLDLRNALRISSNRAAIRLLQEVGVGRVVQYARAVGLDRQPAVPSLALGSGEVTLASLTSAYAAFANGGLVQRPVFIRRVDDEDGSTLMSHRSEASRAISAVTAFLMSDMLGDVVNAGTAWQVRRLGFTLPAAGKTGTTNGFKDAWFVGYTPLLVAGVWVGFDVPRTIVHDGFAGSVAVPLWAHFMRAATEGDAPQWFRPPTGVVSADICPESGNVATEYCPNQRRLYFASGAQPVEPCNAHRPNFFRRIFGLVAGRPPQLMEEPVPDVAGRASPAKAPAPPQPGSASPPARRRGFWSRLLHLGADREESAR